MIHFFQEKQVRNPVYAVVEAILCLVGIGIIAFFWEIGAWAAQVESVDTSSSSQEDETLPEFPQCCIIYVFDDGQMYTVTTEIAMSMMVTDENGEYSIDPETGYYMCDANKMSAFFSGLSYLYPVNEEGSQGFVTKDGLVLNEYDASFQNKIVLDVDAEIEYLASAIMEERQEAHFPIYTIEKGTYIEIDLENQTLYYFDEGEEVFTCPVVTGCVETEHETPPGVYSILGKEQDIDLVGDDYVSFVHYWMNFIGNSYGIHDADWRAQFGGTIYLTNGSHGCVNVSPDVMPELYEMVEIGTPVVIY